MKHELRFSTSFSAINMRTHIALVLGAVAMLLGAPTLVEAQPELKVGPAVNINVVETTDEPQAVVLKVRGKAEHSDDGTAFTELKADHILKEGAVIRTGADAGVDIFFRRIGTTVRLQPDTEVTLEKMAREMKDGTPMMHTLLHLKTGRIFTVVRSFVPGSTFEIRNAAGRSIVEGGGGKGRYIITADGTQVADKDSDVPLKLIGDTGVTIIAPGQTFEAKEGKLLPQDAPDAVLTLIEFDELQALMETSDQLRR